MLQPTQQPLHRSPLRRRCGMLYYGTLRKLLWIRKRRLFARVLQEQPLEHMHFKHRTILLRKLKDVDMWLQYNKIQNLKIAAAAIDGILIRPGEVFSYWYLIGKPTRRKGYVEGMVLENGTFHAGVGGGLCQLSNLLFWMTVHTPLMVVERHRHGYDVFPDSNRTQPFGSGATCFYPHGDLMIYNPTQEVFQIRVNVGVKYLEGEIRSTAAPVSRYEIEERGHTMQSEFWGGYSRHNQLWQLQYDLNGKLQSEQCIVKNSAIMMYEPFLSDSSADGGENPQKEVENDS
ncbi:MAG: vancomycin resistance protein [Ruminococcus sp.]|nr:vancomycin resistance protein [Ruminococcus sp.]